MKGLKDLVHNQNSEILIGNMVIPLTFGTIFARGLTEVLLSYLSPLRDMVDKYSLEYSYLIPFENSGEFKKKKPSGSFLENLCGFFRLCFDFYHDLYSEV